MRRNMSEEEKQKRIKVREFLKQNPISSPDDLNTFFKDMMKVMIEEFYQGELEEELGYTKYDYRNKDSNNSRNGYSSKRLKSSAGEIEVNVPRDRNGEYEPQVIKKHQNTIGQDLEAKIISMYAKGMTTSDIESHIEEIYGYQVSDSSITRITDKILPLVKEWQTRPLEAIYPIVFMDAIHYHVRSEGQIVKKAVYIAIGISSSGEKDVIGMWVGENESAKFWLSKLNELKSRGGAKRFVVKSYNTLVT